jgi:hypothetical protein
MACLLLSALLASPCIALAGTDIIILTAAGEAYNGKPSFRVLANDKIIGVGEIPNAVDTSNGSGLESLTDYGDTIARFVFTVPSLGDVEYLDIEFYNDAWAEGGKPGNRNLYVIGITLSMVEAISKFLHPETVDFGPASFKPQKPEQRGVSITGQWAKLANNGRLRLQRPAGGWLSQPMYSSKPGSIPTNTGNLTPARIKPPSAAPAAKNEVSAKSKAPDPKPEKKAAITGSLPPAQNKKPAKAATAATEKENTKAKKSAAAPPAESTTVESDNPAAQPEEQTKPLNYSRYALPKERCRRIGEKGTDRLC